MGKHKGRRGKPEDPFALKPMTYGLKVGVALLIVSLLIMMFNLFMDQWMVDYGYTSLVSSVRVTWGLIWRKWGGDNMFLYQLFQQAFTTYMSMKGPLILACSSPLCKWYQLKSECYNNLFTVGLGCATAFGLAIIFHGLGIFFVFQRKFECAIIYVFLSSLLQTVSICVFLYAMYEMLATLNTQSMYPYPDPASSFYCACFCVFLSIVAFVLIFIAYSTWEEDEDSDEDDIPGYGGDAQAGYAGDPQAGGGGYPPQEEYPGQWAQTGFDGQSAGYGPPPTGTSPDQYQPQAGPWDGMGAAPMGASQGWEPQSYQQPAYQQPYDGAYGDSSGVNYDIRHQKSLQPQG